MPALAKGNQDEAAHAYDQLTSVYNAHRAIIDEIVKRANAGNTELETMAAQRIEKFSVLVWSVSGVVVLIIVLGITGIAMGVIRPVVRMTSAVSQMAAGDLGIVIPGASPAPTKSATWPRLSPSFGKTPRRKRARRRKPRRDRTRSPPSSARPR